MGTQDVERVYKGRLLPDKNGDFYFKYLYHFFKSGERYYYIKCPKTHDMNAFCPWCYVNQLLWQGNESDKKRAYKYKKNVRFVGNFFVINDPRDSDVDDSERKASNKNFLYEFPEAVESKIKNEMTKLEEGYGPKIFNPEDGHNLLIKIKAKKPDINGKIWPDYSNTEFSRTPSSIAESKEEVEKIMENVYDLSKYLQSLDKDWEFHEKLLKQELVWDDVEDVFIKHVGKNSTEEKETPEESHSTTETFNENSKFEKSDNISDGDDRNNNDSEGNISDEDLLEQLENM